MTKFNTGDLAKWKPEFAQNEAELAQVFVVVEPSDDGKCYIKPAFWDYDKDGVCCPTQFVKIEWIEKAQW